MEQQEIPRGRAEKRRWPCLLSLHLLTIRDILLLALGAFLYTIAAPPYEWSSAAWVALTPLFLVLPDKTLKAALVAGLLYGLFFSAGITYWAYFAVSAYFPLCFPLDLLLTLSIYVFLVCPYTGLAAALASVLMHYGRSLLCWIGIPALWVTAEFTRSSLFSGFSWELLGHTQYRHLTLIQIVDITGVYGLSFLLAFSSYVAAEVLLALRLLPAATSGQEFRRTRSAILGAGLPWPAVGMLATGTALVLCYGMMRLHQWQASPTTRPVNVALVQGNMPSTRRWQRVHYASTLLSYISLTQQGLEDGQPDLVVWPEFAVGFYLDQEPFLRAQLNYLAHRLNAPLLLGAPRMEESETGQHYYNSAYLITPDGRLLDTYDKIYLLPFAEYQPLAFPALLNQQRQYPSEFTAGRSATVFTLPQGNFGVTICYEATYPSLARRLAQGGSQWLINISNDTWLVKGGRAAAAQHFSMTVFRAVENKRALARVATAGISGFVDPTGRPYQLSTGEAGVTIGEVLPRQELTVYTRYGDCFAFACLGLALVALIRTGQQSVRTH